MQRMFAHYPANIFYNSLQVDYLYAQMARLFFNIWPFAKRTFSQ